MSDSVSLLSSPENEPVQVISPVTVHGNPKIWGGSVYKVCLV